MKNKIHVILLFFLCTVVFCQNPPPPDFENPNDDNPTDQPSLPIDTHIATLAIMALFFGLYVIWKKKQSHL